MKLDPMFNFLIFKTVCMFVHHLYRSLWNIDSFSCNWN